MINIRSLLFFALSFCCLCCFGQSDTSAVSVGQKDMIDVLQKVFNKHVDPDSRKTPKRINLSIIPTVGYTLSTGFAAGISTVTTFYTQNAYKDVQSIINAQAFYDSHNQQTFITQSNIYAGKDNYKFVTDVRVEKYPDLTYGLGPLSTKAKADPINYDYVRFYETVLRKLTANLYAGAGYSLDYHYNINEGGNVDNTRSDFDRYGETASSRSSGFNADVLYDSRTNPVNALGGWYANLIVRDNKKYLGSDENWSSMVIDLRKYFKFSASSNNILALWSYTWLTLGGREPYLDLPSIGNDTYNNTGRGYPIGRFRGRDMFYLEAEYRYGITHNGLLGGVVFTNAQSYTRVPSAAAIKNIIPAAGAGIRLKINKHSNTNLAIDYGVGTDSHGFFVNLGEVF
jgi:hypothetical protein